MLQDSATNTNPTSNKASVPSTKTGTITCIISTYQPSDSSLVQNNSVQAQHVSYLLSQGDSCPPQATFLHDLGTAISIWQAAGNQIISTCSNSSPSCRFLNHHPQFPQYQLQQLHQPLEALPGTYLLLLLCSTYGHYKASVDCPCIAEFHALIKEMAFNHGYSLSCW